MVASAIIAILLGIPRIITVGDGKDFARIEDAVNAATEGDTIDVYPSSAGYSKTAIRVRTPHLTIEGIASRPVSLNGNRFDYSGIGAVPRAIFQIDLGGHDAFIQNFELSGAHNASHNGAGIRINDAQHVTVDRCDIHNNDMGAMSNGSADQLFQDCHIHHNGDASDPGFNHNLYLGGLSVTIRHCEVDHSLTGHNIKSRAHFTLVEDCYVHDSANREFDFVEAAETEAPNSNAAIVNSLIAKAPDCTGNRVTIHFGREKGVRNGKLWLIHCTILTPFQSPVVALDGPTVSAEIDRCIIVNTDQAAPALVEVTGGAKLDSVSGSWNWLSSGYSLTGTKVEAKTRFEGTSRSDSLGIVAPTFKALSLPDVGTPDPVYYLDGEGREWEVTPAAVLGAFWRPLH